MDRNGGNAQLRKILWDRAEISIRTKMRIFNTMVIPTLLYGGECWNVLAEDLRRLEVFQTTRLRWMLGISLQDRVSNLEIRNRCCDQPKIDALLRKHRLRWFGHVCRMGNERLPKQLLNSSVPRAWRVPRNAPRKHWTQQIKADLSGLHMDIKYAKDAAQNRAQWRGILRDNHLHAAPARTASLPHRH